jgi:hypothetical protein
MTGHGAYARRNAGHRARRARIYAAARDDAARLSAAFDWFRSSAQLLARRRPPEAADQQAHEAAAAGLIRGMTEHLRQAAEAIDRGDYDTGKG